MTSDHRRTGSKMPDFGEMQRALRRLVERERDGDLPAVQPMYDE